MAVVVRYFFSILLAHCCLHLRDDFCSFPSFLLSFFPTRRLLHIKHALHPCNRFVRKFIFRDDALPQMTIIRHTRSIRDKCNKTNRNNFSLLMFIAIYSNLKSVSLFILAHFLYFVALFITPIKEETAEVSNALTITTNECDGE